MRSALLVVFVLSAVVLAQDVPAAAKKWSWSEEEPSLERSAKALLQEFHVSVVASGSEQWPSPRTIAVKNGEKLVVEVAAWEFGELGKPAYRKTPLARSKDTLFVAEFNPIATGCSVSAYDLRSGRKLWHTDLEGDGPVSHSKYFNRVQMVVIEGVLVVRGWEAAGRYIECLSVETGKQLYHEKLGR